ncbi:MULTISPECIES: D-tagatose-bisphosphate aldolase, class II, non-catalytic subunit [Rhizobium]|uniref:D-tagatose-bisphosphate aldolase, class II, non-catalytic subunit n=1 Tax=Rhizobium TaxID=379 RepID=UPI001B339DE5|nr:MULTISPECIES: D-tagatose-bisphosphate aldolase, class II, non-catalytic subunit [Rhizobium]MBX4909423.1 D-tagatose-bisphosphate aldolase, class II, non-catalytic subunit [Rhizobium bangladeshense]MBX5216293.1 D-tagatose-bisphosphate aldolase, class II, non-catalytic subunit [Rhizobium sp. NLR9a]MBX5234673.1 D-tagatose-bisphosphate aldolase, class II, non-catalytic subunit [Rhizobium sp. NLR4a]MBX5246993.1 D-tagatose-bisphosphate aldolase, class II, non-catalytic subunit [Rhizobium sp. NLR3b]
MDRMLIRLAAARREGRPFGITSVCSAHPVVLRAAIRRAVRDGMPVLIEATCNQVNHLGGYTGMTPEDFIRFAERIATEEGLDRPQMIFGGDHLGPNPWRKERPEAALAKAEAMIEAYVRAGFSKIHLDASMGCAGEPAALDDRTIAERAARLAQVSERTAKAVGAPLPLYILGTEVPVPGGADHALEELRPTAPEAARATIAIHREIFSRAGLEDAFSRVIAFVVQPGVEFGSENVIGYRPELATELTALLDEEPQFVFEAHSTDYQTRDALTRLVKDGFPILKVGPGLTFALREAAYALDMIASEMVAGYGDRPLMAAMDALMLSAPGDWQAHYHGDETALRLQRHYSYSDRIRYYWNKPEADRAFENLLSVLRGKTIPETLLHQYLPQISAAEAGDPETMLITAVDSVLADYQSACGTMP